MNGRFGIESQKQLLLDIQELQDQSAALQKKIEAYEKRISLFDPKRLDPDIIDEKARELLSMADPKDIVVALPEQATPGS